MQTFRYECQCGAKSSKNQKNHGEFLNNHYIECGQPMYPIFKVKNDLRKNTYEDLKKLIIAVSPCDFACGDHGCLMAKKLIKKYNLKFNTVLE